jgi:hypothetical protein
MQAGTGVVSCMMYRHIHDHQDHSPEQQTSRATFIVLVEFNLDEISAHWPAIPDPV